jgi:hypothetical protein
MSACLLLRAGGAIWTESDVILAGGAQFISNRASPEGEFGSGGAIHMLGNSTLSIGGPVTFRKNSASQGGAVTLAAGWWSNPTSTRITFSGSKSSSCWIGNYASVLSGGAALRIEAGGSVQFGTLAAQNFGSNVAGPISSAVEQDIAVLEKGAFQCRATASSSAGNYSIEGDLCAASCMPGKAGCKCPTGQAFEQNLCSCQRTV